MRTRTDLWRLALLTSLGLCPNACGGRGADETGEPDRLTPPGSPEAGTPSEASSTPEPGASPGEATVCTELIRDGVYTGLKECANGAVHRPLAHMCQSTLPRSEPDGGLPQSGLALNECAYDADCTEGAYGHCALRDVVPLGGAPKCSYGCVSDADCSSDEACVCGDPVGTCVSATCRQDADCAEGMKCAQWVDVHGIGCGPGTPLLGCTTPQDECDSDADCEDAEGSTFCSGATGVRQCTAVPNVACGRPFLVEGTERMAALTRTSTWTNTAKLYPQPAFTCAMLEPLTEAQRHELGERWAELGLMEHASVAAFARFTLQLLHVGAPAVFVEDAQRAMADETRHAQDCFALACRYLGYAVGPGALSMHHALQETTLEDIVRLTVREGCIGETCAALEAAEAYEATIDLEVKAVLDRIRVEELRHAELAWRFVNWALTEGAPNNVTKARLHQIVAAEFSAAASDVASHPITRALVEPFDTMPHGIVPKQMLPEIRRRALLDVVLPCGESLLHSLITTSYSQITAPMPELIAKPVDVSLM